MTAQTPDFVEYAGAEYCLMAYAGGRLPSAKDFGMHFHPGSTADARGYCLYYGLGETDLLVVKKIEVRGEESLPINHHYTRTNTNNRVFYDDLNQIVPITGYILFSDVLRFYL